jgi:alkanesulfonate monooxygenase SsuD/methylene tetrahydromethanopterin reductase-like flavin-dependent oxidoreductase (luciferase family)
VKQSAAVRYHRGSSQQQVAPMRISASPSGTRAIAALADLAPLAEAAGYHGLWRAEGVAWDAFTVCTLWAARTRRLQVATGIVSAVTRHPGALARAAATVQELSHGRFRLGLGIGNNPEVPQPAAPLATMREVARAVRDHWRERLVPDTTAPAPPLWFAALRPKMVALAAASADGVLLNWVTPAYVREVRAMVGPDFPIACLVRAHAGPRAATLAELRENLAFYRRLAVYRHALELQGLDPDGLDDAAALALVLRDRADQAAWQEAGVDELVVRPLGPDDAAVLRHFAPA